MDSQVGQRIWGRYGTSPGVIPLDSVLQRAGYKTQFGISRLPLLVDIQRRWAFANAPFQHSWPTLPYAYPTIIADDLSTATAVSEPSSRPGLTGQVSPAAPTNVLQPTIEGGGRSNEPLTAATAKISTGLNNSGDSMLVRSLQRKAVTAEPARPATPAPVYNGVMTHPASFSVEGGSQPVVIDDGQHTAETPTVSPATSTGQLGTTILQRYLHGPAARTVQRPTLPDSRLTGDIRENVTPSISQGKKGPTQQPAVVAVHPAVKTATAMPPASGTGDWGSAILQRHLNRPSERIIQRTMATSEPVRPAAPAPVDNGVMAHPASFSGEGEPRSAIDVGQQTAETPTISPTTSTDQLGTAILQRYLDGPAARMVQSTVATPRQTLPDNRPRGDIRENVGPSISQGKKGPTLQPSVAAGQFMAEAGIEKPAMKSSDHFGTTILQRYPNGPSEWIIQPMVKPPVLVPHDKGTSWSRQTTHRERTTDMVEGMVNRPVRSGDTFFDATSEMPVWRVANRHVEKTAVDNAMPFQNHPAKGYRFDMPGVPAAPTGRLPSIQTQQETASSTSTAIPAAPPPVELPTRTATEPASEVDVMGVADQVYEILVSRLASERERRGL